MSREPEDYPQYMMLEDEREAEEARAAAGYPKPLPESDLAVLRAAYARREREDRERDARLYARHEVNP